MSTKENTSETAKKPATRARTAERNKVNEKQENEQFDETMAISDCIPEQEPALRQLLMNLLKSKEFMDTLESVCKQTMEKVVCENCEKMKQQIERNESEILDLQSTLDNKNRELQSLKKCVDLETSKREVTERQLNDLEQYTRRNSIRIFGVKEQANEDTDQIAVDIANKKLGFQLTKRDIDRSHRVQQKDPKKPKPIIVKLCSYKDKSSFMRNKKKLKGTGTSIQEDLTVQNLILLQKTSRSDKVSAAWTVDGRVFAAVKTTDEKVTLKRRINRESDLNKL